MHKEFKGELNVWINNGWLVPHDKQQHGAPWGIVLPMAVRQNNGSKVFPILDYYKLKDHMTAFTADSNMCANYLRKWCHHVVNVAVLNLRKAYLQGSVNWQQGEVVHP